MNTLETIADLFDPEGELETAYVCWSHSEEQLDLARVLAGYQALPKSAQTFYLALAALEAAPEGIEVNINMKSAMYRAKTTARGEFEYLTEAWQPSGYFRTLDSDAAVYVAFSTRRTYEH